MEEYAQACCVAVDRSPRTSAAGALCRDEPIQVRDRERVQWPILIAEPTEELVDYPAATVNRVLGQAAFGPHPVGKRGDLGLMLMARSNRWHLQAAQEAQPPRCPRHELHYGGRLGMLARPSEPWQRPLRGCGFDLHQWNLAATLAQIQQAHHLKLIDRNCAEIERLASQLEPVPEIAQAALHQRRGLTYCSTVSVDLKNCCAPVRAAHRNLPTKPLHDDASRGRLPRIVPDAQPAQPRPPLHRHPTPEIQSP